MTDKPATPNKPAGFGTDRRGGMRALAANLPAIARPVLGKRGFGEAQLVAQWPAIVGEDLARNLMPEKLSFAGRQRQDGTLRARVEPAFALIAQHREPQILERINAFFGYRAVARLALVQGPLPRDARRAAPPARPLDAAEHSALDQRLAGIENDALRDALKSLGEKILGARKS
ncbi:MAG TPA: DciA family protein [Stellaceae bacterium]|nr:DciA family protein [Stellaceae bacterium]